jgi:regulator of RNase E activity RraB
MSGRNKTQPSTQNAAAKKRATRAYRLEHHFISDDKSPLEALAIEAKKAGYEITRIVRTDPAEWEDEDEEEGEEMAPYYSCDLLVDVESLDPEVISAESVKMSAWSMQFGVEYDGWGAAAP